VPTIHLSREYSQSPLQGHPPVERHILLFLRGDVGQHRCLAPAAHPPADLRRRCWYATSGMAMRPSVVLRPLWCSPRLQ